MADLTARGMAQQAKTLAIGTTNGETVDARTGADSVARTTLGAFVREIHQAQLNHNATLADANKQSQTLVNGVSVVNGTLDAPADVQINGRTLVSLGSSVLDATKNYVLANKKTILKWADATTTQGVAKFTGKGEKPAIIHVSNFENKVSGSTVESPHITKVTSLNSNYSSLLVPSSVSWAEINASGTAYGLITKQDNSVYNQSTNVSGAVCQSLHQFDIIQAIERNIGRIPKPDLAGKIQWVKDNTNIFTFNWYGYGSGPNGNKAVMQIWNSNVNSWNSATSHTSGSVTKLTRAESAPLGDILGNYIDSNGFANFLAYADPAGLVADPTVAPTLSASGSGSSLSAGTYYVKYEWRTANGVSLASPEANITITAGQNIVVTPPSFPFGVISFGVYVSPTSGTGQFSGNTSSSTYTITSYNASGGNSASGSTAIVNSSINIDYVEIQIELKQTASLQDPLVALYEVPDATDYANILTTWVDTDVMNRYPKVQAVQHLQNPYVMASGENMVDYLSELSAISPNDVSIDSDGSIKVVNPNNFYPKSISTQFAPNQQYTIAYDVKFTASSGTYGGLEFVWNYTDGTSTTFGYVTPNQDFVHLVSTSASGKSVKSLSFTYGVYSTNTNFKNVMLTVGAVEKPYTPYNPSYLFATAKLGQIGTVKDTLYKQDGTWYVRQAIQKDVVLDGSAGWNAVSDFSGYKYFNVPIANGNGSANNDAPSTCIKYDGKKLGYVTTWSPDVFQIFGNVIRICVNDTETGFGDSYVPNTQEISAYFYGWQAATVDANGKPLTWQSLGDGTAAPTQTLAYVSTTKAPNFTPYKLSYVLATPQVVTASVEGDIALNGLTQVTVGSGVIVREKVVPQLYSSYYFINYTLSPASVLKNKANSVITIYKNGVKDTKWSFVIGTTNNYGSIRAYIAIADYDATAEYTVTYQPYTLDNTIPALTNNATEVKATYDTSLKSVIDTLSERQSDLSATASVNVQAIAELYKRVKGLGG